MANKTELKNVENKIPNTDAFVKKSDYAIEIKGIKNDYVTNAALTSQLNDLKSQHIADEVKKVEDKVTENSSDILGFQSRLKQKEDTVNDVQREMSYFRGKHSYERDGLQNYLVFKGLYSSFERSTGLNITKWKSSGIYDNDDGTL